MWINDTWVNTTSACQVPYLIFIALFCIQSPQIKATSMHQHSSAFGGTFSFNCNLWTKNLCVEIFILQKFHHGTSKQTIRGAKNVMRYLTCIKHKITCGLRKYRDAASSEEKRGLQKSFHLPTSAWKSNHRFRIQFKYAMPMNSHFNLKNLVYIVSVCRKYNWLVSHGCCQHTIIELYRACVNTLSVLMALI